MKLFRVAGAVAVFTIVAGCSTSSSRALTAEPISASSGPVFVTQAALPASIEYKIVGSVNAEANVGYERVPTLYPMLADEARKLGANAVMSAQGGRRLAPFSWSAAYVSGTAVKVANPEKLKGLTGSYH